MTVLLQFPHKESKIVINVPIMRDTLETVVIVFVVTRRSCLPRRSLFVYSLV